MKTTKIPDTVVIYHADCLDGKLAAWTAFRSYEIKEELPFEVNPFTPLPAPRVFERMDGSKLTMIPAVYGDILRDHAGKNVYILDFSFSVAAMLKCAETANMVIVLDHHLSMVKNIDKHQAVAAQLLKKETSPELKEILKLDVLKALNHDTRKDKEGKPEVLSANWTNQQGNLEIVYNLLRSGAGMTWRHINPDKAFPGIIAYGQDHDLYNHALPFAGSVSAAMHNMLLIPEGFEVVEEMYKDWEEDEYYVSKLDNIGVPLLRHIDHVVKNSIQRNSLRVDVGPHKNIPINICVRAYRTRMGELMAFNAPFSVTYEDIVSEGVREYSFRSHKDYPDAVNVEEIARSYGGGGHKRAAGVRVGIGVDIFK